VEGPSRSFQSTPIDQLLPNKSNKAMMWLPDLEPRTGLPGVGNFMILFLATLIVASYIKCSDCQNYFLFIMNKEKGVVFFF
jgi:hypothetical protein